MESRLTQQVSLGAEARADSGAGGDGTHEIAPDLAYRLLAMVNAVFVGRPDAGDRGWVLIDTGIPGPKALITSAAEARFGSGARPSAIVMTHGHFYHVGALEDLTGEWDVPVYAHGLEHPYLDGSASYPPGDPTVRGGLMASAAGRLPTKSVDVSGRLELLPDDGTIPRMPSWRWLHTPGHSVGHVSLWREGDRAVIAGDAFVTTTPESAYATAVQSPEMHGPPRYFTVDWEKARASVDALAALRPALAITGHGRAMRGSKMTDALASLAGDFDRIAVPPRGRYVVQPVRIEDGSAYERA